MLTTEKWTYPLLSKDIVPPNLHRSVAMESRVCEYNGCVRKPIGMNYCHQHCNCDSCDQSRVKSKTMSRVCEVLSNGALRIQCTFKRQRCGP